MSLLKKIITIDSVDSTNNYVKKQLDCKTYELGTLVYAKAQTKGRGQQGNEWISQEGKNITCSFVIFPKLIYSNQQFLISQFVSLAVVDFINQYINTSILIKWPNDILVNEKKICGILIENSIRGSLIQHSVIGIGININQLFFNEPILNAVSLKELTGIVHDLFECLNKLCICINKYYIEFEQKNVNLINNNYHKYLYKLNTYSPFEIKNKITIGKIIGVNPEGKLLLEKEDNTMIELSNKEIKFI